MSGSKNLPMLSSRTHFVTSGPLVAQNIQLVKGQWDAETIVEWRSMFMLWAEYNVSLITSIVYVSLDNFTPVGIAASPNNSSCYKFSRALALGIDRWYIIRWAENLPNCQITPRWCLLLSLVEFLTSLSLSCIIDEYEAFLTSPKYRPLLSLTGWFIVAIMVTNQARSCAWKTSVYDDHTKKILIC